MIAGRELGKKSTKKNEPSRQAWIDQLGDLAEKDSSALFLSSLKQALKKDGFTLNNLLFAPTQSEPKKNWSVIDRLLFNAKLQPLTDLIRDYPQTLRITDPNGSGLLSFAISFGRLEALNQLLTLCKEFDTDAINFFNPPGMPPLTQALRSNLAISSRLLLEAGANRDQIFSMRGQDTTPRQLAEQHGIAGLFDGKKVPFPDDIHSVFMESLQNNRTFEIQAVLATYLFTPNQLRQRNSDKSNDTLLHAAIKGGSLDSVRQVLALMGTAGQQKLLILETNNQGQNALRLAAELGHTDIVSHLHAAGEFEPAERAALINRVNRRTGEPELNQPNKPETAKEIAPEKPALAAPATAPNIAPKPEPLPQPIQTPAAQAPKPAAPKPTPAPRPALPFSEKRPADQKRQFLAACKSRDASRMSEMLAHIELAPILHELALNGDWLKFDFLIEQIGVDAAAPCASKNDASTPLHTAAQRSQVDFILRVAEKYPQLLSQTTPELKTPLHTFLIAASAKDTKALLEGAVKTPTLLEQLNTAPEGGVSPLQGLQNHHDRHANKTAGLQALKKALGVVEQAQIPTSKSAPTRPPQASRTRAASTIHTQTPVPPYVAVEIPLPSTSGGALTKPTPPERKTSIGSLCSTDSAGSVSSSEIPPSVSELGPTGLPPKQQVQPNSPRARASNPVSDIEKKELLEAYLKHRKEFSQGPNCANDNSASLWKLYKEQSTASSEQQSVNTPKVQAVLELVKSLTAKELALVHAETTQLVMNDRSACKI